MKHSELHDLLLSKPGAQLSFPFGPDAAVYKVLGKMFALIAVDEQPIRLTLKCEPSNAVALRDMFPSINPGYHMNKEHWNTITLDGSIPEEILFQMVHDSYELIIHKLTTAQRNSLSDIH